MKTFREKTLKGIKWSFINKVLSQILRFILTIVLARLLSPSDFGLFAMITVFSSFALVLRDAGFGQALIYKQELNDKDFDSVFWLNTLIGVIFTGIFFFGSSSLANFYGQQELTGLTKVISVIFIIQAIGGINTIELRKNVNFKKIAIVNNSAFLISSAAAIILAFKGYGVWCLVWKAIIENTLITVFTFFVTKFRPKNNFSIASLGNIWKYSLSVSSNKIVNYWTRNADNLMIGKILNQRALGEYNMAYQIMLFPIQNISHVISQVLFPAFSTVQNDLVKIRSVYLKMVQTIALVVFPVMIGLIFIPDLFVNIVLGDKWTGIISFLPWLALVSMPQSIFTISGSVYMSIGKPQIPLKINLISLPFYLLGFYIGLKTNGIMGLIWFYVIINILSFIPIYYFLAKSIDLSFKRYIRNLYPVIISCFSMTIIILLGRKVILALNIQSILEFITIIALAACTYVGSLYCQRKNVYLLKMIFD